MLRPVFLVDGWARFREMPWNYCFLFILQCWLSIPGLFNRTKLLFSMNNYIWTILMPQEMSCVHTGLWDGIFTSLVFPHRGLSDEPIRRYIFVCDSWSQLVIEIRQNVNADVPLWKETRVELHLSFCFFSTYWNVSYSLEAPLSAFVLVPNRQTYFKEVRAN